MFMTLPHHVFLIMQTFLVVEIMNVSNSLNVNNWPKFAKSCNLLKAVGALLYVLLPFQTWLWSLVCDIVSSCWKSWSVCFFIISRVQASVVSLSDIHISWSALVECVVNMYLELGSLVPSTVHVGTTCNDREGDWSQLGVILTSLTGFHSSSIWSKSSYGEIMPFANWCNFQVTFYRASGKFRIFPEISWFYKIFYFPTSSLSIPPFMFHAC